MGELDAERICLDTDILIDNLRGIEETVRRIRELEVSGFILSTTAVSAFELYYGVEKTEKREKNREAVTRLLGRLVVYDFTEEAAERAGKIVADLEAGGNPIDFRDAFIGATTIVNGSALFTRNTSHFLRVAELRLFEGN